MNYYRTIALMLILLGSVSFAYTAHFTAPAVLIGLDRGEITNISLAVNPGNGTIIVNNGSHNVGNDTISSIHTAVAYATRYLNFSEKKYNFAFQIDNNYSNISGPSGGFAFTLLTISGLEKRPLLGNFTVTGTISADGSVGPVGGVFDKVGAANAVDSEFILVPSVDRFSSEYLLYYMAQQVYKIPVVEISNVSQGLPYAFGVKEPQNLSLNITNDYHVGMIPNVSAICPLCNESVFGPLTAFTFNFTQNQIDQINGTLFGSAKVQLDSQLQQYKQISSKGYYYTGADFAFIEDPTAFMLRYANVSKLQAGRIIANMSTYCNALNYTPNMTSQNYEFIIGGKLRLSWALMTLKSASAFLNSSQTSDEIMQALQVAAPAQAWCAATSEMYNISAGMGGYPVTQSSNLRNQALSELAYAQKVYGNQLYVQAANYSIASGDYATALYSLTYASVFYNSTVPSYNTTSSAVSMALSRATGIWPTQFALQSAFYLNEANVSNSTSAYAPDIYSTARLSLALGSLNSEIYAGLTPSHAYLDTEETQISSLSAQVQTLTYVLMLVIILLMVAFAILIFLIVNRPKPAEAAQSIAQKQAQQASKKSTPKRRRSR